MTTTVELRGLTQFLLRRADDNLVLAQRLGEWISWGPDLEEDIALGNLALDHLGVARGFYHHAAELEGAGRTEDDLAFLRTERDFTNLVLCEQPNGDFAKTMVRQLLMDAYHEVIWDRLSSSPDHRIAGIAAKAAKETAYHLRHTGGWVVRLGDGTEESRRRVLAAIDGLWKYTGELFTFDELDEEHLRDAGSAHASWTRTLANVLGRADIDIPEPASTTLDGRSGIHTEHLGHMLAEMQWMQRTYPGLTW